jgi:hypothetical protein
MAAASMGMETQVADSNISIDASVASDRLMMAQGPWLGSADCLRVGSNPL